MRHATDGSLRRMIDEEWAVPEDLRRHVADCGLCRGRLAELRSLADETQGLLAGAGAPQDARAALGRQRVLQDSGREAQAGVWRLPRPGRLRWGGALAGFFALLLLVTATPVGGYARNLLLIFQPKQFTAVPLAPGQAKTLIGPEALGALRQSGGRSLQAAQDLASLEAQVGFRMTLPAAPAGVGAPSYAVLAQGAQSLTFSQATLAAYARSHDLNLPAMPASISGSTLTVTTGPVAVVSYGAPAAQIVQEGSAPPNLALAEAPVPKVYSTGATVADIETYVLGLPGVSPQLAGEIEAIQNPTETLPILVPTGQATSQSVEVGGAQGLWVQESSGKLGGVVWTSGGHVFTVVGTLGETEILRLAAELK